MRIGSLFSGIGGLELGLEWAGVGHTTWQVELDEWCRSKLAKHWPDAQRFADVCEVGAHNLPPVDVICGGFPCQDVSVAGKNAGLAGERSGLWREYARIIRELRPSYVVVENVAALTNRGLFAVLGTLADLGYDAEWSCIQALDVGAPHERDRLFLIAYAERDAVRLESERHQQHAIERWHAEPRHDGAQESLADADDERGRLECDSADSAWQRQRAPRQESRGRGAEYMADAHGIGCQRSRLAESGRIESARGREPDRRGAIGQQYDAEALSDASRGGCRAQCGAVAVSPQLASAGCLCEGVSDPDVSRLGEHRQSDTRRAIGRDAGGGYAACYRSDGRHAAVADRATESSMGCGIDGLSARLVGLVTAEMWRDGSWEAGIPRVVPNFKGRRPMLRALGNAVVPQVAEVVGRRLMEIHITRGNP